MNSPGSGHVHGGRAGRMSFERAVPLDLDDDFDPGVLEGGILPSHPLDHPDPELDREAAAFFRAKLERL